MTVDVFTLMIAIIVNDLAMAAAMFTVSRARHPELRIWAIALTCHAAGYLLFVLRPIIGLPLSAVFGNMALAAAYALFLAALEQFRRRPVSWPSVAAAPLLIALLFPSLLDDLAMRSVLTALIFGVICVLALVRLDAFRRHTQGWGICIMIAGFALLGIVFAVRLYAGLVGHLDLPSLTSPHPVQTISFLTSIVGLVVLTVGMTLMIIERETAALADANARLLQLSRTDALTGLANRRALDETLQREGARARRTGAPLSVLLCDVDHFKRYNDRFGHPAGDECLVAVAATLKTCARRPGDLVARYGGEEFVVMLGDTTENAALEMARELCRHVARLAMPHPDSSHGVVTISVGVAGRAGGFADQGADLLAAADQALYRAKAAGRNRALGADASQSVESKPQA